jgi:hypothetical protein
MKKAKISFRVFGGSGPLSISWFPGPKGNAIEAKNEMGVGFFSTDGELLSVEFDDVNEKKDHQILEFDRYRVEVFVNRGKVSYSLIPFKGSKKSIRSSKKKMKDAA